MVAILAVAALYWPISGMYTDLQTKLTARVRVGSDVEQQVNAQRFMPQLSPDQTGQDPLPVFPTQAVFEEADKATKKIADQAVAHDEGGGGRQRASAAGGRGTSQARPDQAARPHLREQEIRLREKVFRGDNGPGALAEDAELGALPTETEITAKKEQVKKDIQDARFKQQDEEIKARQDLVPVQMQLERALQSSVYMQPDAIVVDKSINTTAAIPSPEQIAKAQIALWTLDDVVTAINRANVKYSDRPANAPATRPDVLHAAVKQVLKIENPAPVLSTNGGDLTAGVTSTVPKSAAVSPSARVCNGLYDVARFKVSLIVDAAKLNQVVQELETNQFITVMNIQINEVTDPAIAAAKGFRFGDKPMLNVDLDCEELFLRAWTTPLLPDTFKMGLGKGQTITNTGDDPNAQPTQ